jgi:hypothetical protein
MSVEVTMEDGTAADLIEHLTQDHRKGTRGFTAEYLANLHESLHQPKRDPLPGHSHPIAIVEIPQQTGPAETYLG